MIEGLTKWFLRAAVGGLAVVALLAPGCSSSSSGGSSCNSSPWTCGTGTTCWPECGCTSGKTCTIANCSLQFACLPSGTVTEGQACSLDVGSQKATCADGLTCVSFADAGAGACRPYCDQNGGCAPGHECVELTVTAGSQSASERVCVPPNVLLDAGLMIEDSATGSSSGALPADARLDISFDTNSDSPLQM